MNYNKLDGTFKSQQDLDTMFAVSRTQSPHKAGVLWLDYPTTYSTFLIFDNNKASKLYHFLEEIKQL